LTGPFSNGPEIAPIEVATAGTTFVIEKCPSPNGAGL